MAKTQPFLIGKERRAASFLADAAWFLAALFYFYQYALRSAPAVMMPELSEAFGLSAMGVASMMGLFYYGYAPFSLIAGISMDRLGPRRLIPVAAALVGVGALLFATGDRGLASAGRFLQGAGGVFALIGAIYIAGKAFPPSRAATLIGATQMFGMAGGSAGQFMAGPMIAEGMAWSHFWIGMGVIGLSIGAILFFLLPKDEASPRVAKADAWMKSAIGAFAAVFRNPQSIMCGLIAGLLFLPTTIFDMIWGVRYLQDAHGVDYGEAVMRSASVPLGWIIGCPLLGFLSDMIGRRKPVMIGGAATLWICLVWILYGRIDVFPAHVVGLTAGIASGAAMLPYTVIKEANASQFSGTATGVINFINFSLSALLGPVFAKLLQQASGGAAPMRLEHYQSAFALLLSGLVLAIVLTLLLKETGVAARSAPSD
jgi:MFS family permease